MCGESPHHFEVIGSSLCQLVNEFPLSNRTCSVSTADHQKYHQITIRCTVNGYCKHHIKFTWLIEMLLLNNRGRHLSDSIMLYFVTLAGNMCCHSLLTHPPPQAYIYVIQSYCTCATDIYIRPSLQALCALPGTANSSTVALWTCWTGAALCRIR